MQITNSPQENFEDYLLLNPDKVKGVLEVVEMLKSISVERLDPFNQCAKLILNSIPESHLPKVE